jgi:hypothetical protein
LRVCCHNSKGRFLVATLAVVTPQTTTTTISTASATVVVVVVVVALPLHGTFVWAILQEVVTPVGKAAVNGVAATVRATTASMVATATLHRFATTSTVKVFLSGQPFSVS